MDVKWINSTGGPLVCGAPAACRVWSGINRQDDQTISDYERACSIYGYIGVLSSGFEYMLVLGDEPHQSCLATGSQGEVVVCRWVSARIGFHLSELFDNLAGPLRQLSDPVEFSLREDRLFLFDPSANGAVGMAEGSSIDVFQGRYWVTTEQFKIAGQYNFILHRFLLA